MCLKRLWLEAVWCTETKPGLQGWKQVAVKEVCVISGRGVCSRSGAGGKGSDINLTNDEEEGFSAMKAEEGGFQL